MRSLYLYCLIFFRLLFLVFHFLLLIANDFDGNIISHYDTTYNSGYINDTFGVKNRFYVKFNDNGYKYVMLGDNGTQTITTNYNDYYSTVNDHIYND